MMTWRKHNNPPPERPTLVNGEVWVFNKSYTQYIPLSIYDLQAWTGTPSIYVFDCSGAGLVVNTTSLGMHGQPPLQVRLDALPGDAVVNDIVYVPLQTPLLADAAARGLRTVDGLGMLLHQARPGFERWFGHKPEVSQALYATIVRDLLS